MDYHSRSNKLPGHSELATVKVTRLIARLLGRLCVSDVKMHTYMRRKRRRRGRRRKENVNLTGIREMKIRTNTRYHFLPSNKEQLKSRADNGIR